MLVYSTALRVTIKKRRPPVKAPVISSQWRRIVEYPDNHLNDFCLFEDGEGTWHCIGIMGEGTWKSEQSFFHCTGKSLRESFTIRSPMLTGEVRVVSGRSRNRAPQKHAPFVVYHDDMYHMFFRRPMGTNLHIRTRNPYDWPSNAELVFEESDARDVCILDINGVFHMYYCQLASVDGEDRSCIMLRQSADLIDWSEPMIVHVDMSETADHSFLESPFVVKNQEGYYLFIRHRRMDENVSTVVLYSEQPDCFPSGERAWFHRLDMVHAPEIVEHAGEFYIARVSGPPDVSSRYESNGNWIEIARLEFK